MKFDTYKGQVQHLLPNLLIEADEHDHRIRSLTIFNSVTMEPLLKIIEDYSALKVLVPAKTEE
jgi:hypothetical protein